MATAYVSLHFQNGWVISIMENKYLYLQQFDQKKREVMQKMWNELQLQEQ